MTDQLAPANDHALSPGTVIAGYRLLRRISLEAGSVCWLARTIDENETVSISLHRETDAVAQRVRAHATVRSPHVLALRDVATDADGCIVLVCERTEWTLAALLASRTRLAAGEAVTILAPLVSGLAAIQEAGFSHGRLTASSVLFSPDGRPVIGGLEFLRESGSTATTGTDLLADRRALASLISLVAEIVDAPAREELDAVSSWLTQSLSDDSSPAGLLGQVECRLFALARGLPVVLGADRKIPPTEPDTRHGFSLASARRAAGALPGGARVAATVLRSGIGGWAARAVRGRTLAVCVGILVLVGTLVTGLALVPETNPAVPAPHPVPEPTTPAATPATPAASAGGTGAALSGDDVVAATTALLALRADCLSGESTGCVSRYAEHGSALADADSHRASAGRLGELLVATNSRARIEEVQAYGDAVLLRVHGEDDKRQPVLVLTVRTDTGWRLRDAFEPD